MDDNASESKKPVRKPLSQTTQQRRCERSSKDARNSEERCDSCSSPSSGRPKYSAPIESEILRLYPNLDTDDNASESERPMSKPLCQTISTAQFHAKNEAGVHGAAKTPKSSERRERQKKNGNCEKKGESSRSPSNGRPEYSSPTRVKEEYRALRRDYLILEEEHDSLNDEVIEVENDIKLLEAEKHTLLDKLVVLEGLVEDSDLECST